MTLKQGLLVGAACLLVGLVAGYCYEGKVASEAYDRLLVAYNAHLHADSLAAAQDSSRRDTVIAIHTIIVVDSARADSLGRVVAGQDSALRAHLAADSVGGAMFDAFARTVQARDSVRNVQIANLGRVVAVQDTQLVALRGRLTEANVLLAQAIGVARALDARASRRWHLAAMIGYGVTGASGTVRAGPQVGVGLAYVF